MHSGQACAPRLRLGGAPGPEAVAAVAARERRPGPAAAIGVAVVRARVRHAPRRQVRRDVGAVAGLQRVCAVRAMVLVVGVACQGGVRRVVQLLGGGVLRVLAAAADGRLRAATRLLRQQQCHCQDQG